MGSLQARLSTLAHTKLGRGMRFITITGIGFIPVVGSALAPVLGGLDRFLLEKLFPHSGPASFINNLYPSIFKNT